jgi:hypothetical protein
VTNWSRVKAWRATMVLLGTDRFDGMTRDERRGQFPIDAARRGPDAAGLEDQSLEGIRLGTLTRLGATIA